MTNTRNHARKLSRWLHRRFAFFRWPAARMTERVRAVRGQRLMNERAERKKFPLRAIRYWWAHNALLDESRARPAGWVIADVGCSSGILKRYVGEIPGAKWIGLDWNIQEEALRACGYDGWHACDFDQTLPLPDASADVVIFLHVIEHLPRPEVTLREIGRILKPGGVLLAGSPVAPRWVARIREAQLQRELARGDREAGRHCNSMDCRRWEDLVRGAGMEPTLLTGAFLARWSGNPLENTAWWLRLNQAWGALFPGLGGEVYLAARRSDAPPAAAPALAPEAAWPASPLAWARTPLWVGVALVMLLLGMWAIPESEGCNCPISQNLAAMQDGNNRFHTLPYSETADAVAGGALVLVSRADALDDAVGDSLRNGEDPFLVIPHDARTEVEALALGLGLTETRELEAGDDRYLVYGLPDRAAPQ